MLLSFWLLAGLQVPTGAKYDPRAIRSVVPRDQVSTALVVGEQTPVVHSVAL